MTLRPYHAFFTLQFWSISHKALTAHLSLPDHSEHRSVLSKEGSMS